MTWITRESAAEKLGCKESSLAYLIRQSRLDVLHKDPDERLDNGGSLPRMYWGPDIDRVAEWMAQRPARNSKAAAMAASQSQINAEQIMYRPWTRQGLQGLFQEV